VPVALVVDSPQILTVNSALPVHSLAEFIGYARTIPARSILHRRASARSRICSARCCSSLPISSSCTCRIRGSAPAIVDLLAGQVQMMFDSPRSCCRTSRPASCAHVAVTSASRMAQLPDVPTMSEAGYPQLAATLWTGLMAPAGTPEPIVRKLNMAPNAGLQTPEAQAAIHQLGVDTRPLTPQAFGEFMTAQTRKWAQVVAAAGIKGE